MDGQRRDTGPRYIRVYMPRAGLPIGPSRRTLIKHFSALVADVGATDKYTRDAGEGAVVNDICIRAVRSGTGKSRGFLR